MKDKFILAVYASIAGVLTALIVYFFYISLNYLAQLRLRHENLILLLPVVGILLGFLYLKFSNEMKNHVKDLSPPPKSTFSIFLTFATPLLSHLAGASTGREGVGLQLGSQLANKLAKTSKLSKKFSNEFQNYLVIAGLAAGFSAILGTPLAAILFAIEFTKSWRNLLVWITCAIASFSAYEIVELLHLPYSYFPRLISLDFHFNWLLAILIFIFSLAILAIIFSKSILKIEFFSKKIFPNLLLRGLLGGALISFIFLYFHLNKFAGLGISEIQSSFIYNSSNWDFLIKLILTCLCLGFGFKGGEFIPLVFIGTTLGSAMAGWFTVPTQLLATMGFASLYGITHRVPLACSLMAIELFGLHSTPYVIVGCVGSYLLNHEIRKLHFMKQTTN